MNDTVEIEGLTPLLDDDEEPPYLELVLRCNEQTYRTAILPADGEWTLRIEDGFGKTCPGSGEFYPTQADAILAAMLTALELSPPVADSAQTADGPGPLFFLRRESRRPDN
jgi:hypothetical protein